MTKEERQAIRTTIERLKAASDPNDPGCGVAPEHKRAVSLYLTTWVIPQLESVATPANKRTFDQREIIRGSQRR